MIEYPGMPTDTMSYDMLPANDLCRAKLAHSR